MITKPPYIAVAGTLAVVLVAVSQIVPFERIWLNSTVEFRPAPSVYDAILSSFFLDSAQSHRIWGSLDYVTGSILLYDSTRPSFLDSTSALAENIQRTFPGLERDLVASYLAANQMPTSLRPTSFAVAGVTLVDAVTLRELMSSLDLSRYAEYPDAKGVLVLSRIGYTNDSAIALVHISHGFNSEDGVGFYIRLQRTTEGWLVTECRMSGII